MSGWLTTRGARLRGDVTGAGAPLVLMHGWTMDRRVFRFQVDALAERFRVVTYDRRGFGESPGPPDLDRELDDLDTIARDVAGDRFHLLGLSQGGRIAALRRHAAAAAAGRARQRKESAAAATAATCATSPSLRPTTPP